MEYLAVFIGGGCGSMLRFYFSPFNNPENFLLPIGTMIANFFSCIILGYTAAYLAQESSNDWPIKALIAVGFCGGFSTFSTFSLESFKLLRDGFPFYALGNIFISIIICLLAIWVGYWLQGK